MASSLIQVSRPGAKRPRLHEHVAHGGGLDRPVGRPARGQEQVVGATAARYLGQRLLNGVDALVAGTLDLFERLFLFGPVGAADGHDGPKRKLLARELPVSLELELRVGQNRSWRAIRIRTPMA